MTEFSWNDPQFKTGEFVEWEEGTVVVGTVKALQTHSYEANERGPGRTVPQVIVGTEAGHDVEITCGPADLKKKMVAAAPAIGDRIRVECIGTTKVSVGIQRFFTVKVQKAAHTQAVADGNAISNAKAQRLEAPDETIFGASAPNGADARSTYPEEAPF